ncbi:MAG: hypothetical protein QXK80_01950 [Candidatus Pacearchaeota archaeon]
MRKECPNKNENEKQCPCPYLDCERHGICCECILYHRKDKSKPMCLK